MTTVIKPIPESSWTWQKVKRDFCQHPEHEMPKHLYIPPGHEAIHTCPACGKITTATNPIVFGVTI